MKRSLALESNEAIGQQIMLMGWVNSRRDHGGVIFIDLRDESGIVQLTIHPDHESAFKIAEDARDEYVLRARGKVISRESGLVNEDIATGGVEVVVEELEILNKSEPLPFSVSNDNQMAGEETRLAYRYIDLRREKMQQMLVKRSKFNHEIHKFMQAADFTEIATPILANSSPEGARDYLVPSRMHPGKFYALPQSPQQFKQLLMVGGLPRYYQIAPCFRDEDPRADRHQGDFYHLDLEVAFATDGEQIREITEPLIKQLVTEFGGKKLHSEDIPRITYNDSMNTYGTDKPDLRFGMELVDLSDELKNTEFGVFTNTIKDGGVVKAICVADGVSLSRKEIDGFTEVAKSEGAGGLAYIFVEDGKARSPIAKFLSDDEIQAIISKTTRRCQQGTWSTS